MNLTSNVEWAIRKKICIKGTYDEKVQNSTFRDNKYLNSKISFCFFPQSNGTQEQSRRTNLLLSFLFFSEVPELSLDLQLS